MNRQVRLEDGRLIVGRVYDGSREAVFDAWVYSSKAPPWWGCAEPTHVRSEVDARVGGECDHHMTLDGNALLGEATITEYDPPARRAYRSAAPDRRREVLVTVEFSEVAGGTLVALAGQGAPDMRVGPDVESLEVTPGGWTAADQRLGVFSASNLER